jgi:hypothetical protein
MIAVLLPGNYLEEYQVKNKDPFKFILFLVEGRNALRVLVEEWFRLVA